MTEYTLDEREERAMPKKSAKTANKVAKKTGAVRRAGGRFAGRTAPKLSEQAEELLETTGPFAEADPPVEEAKPEAEAKFAEGGTATGGPTARIGDRAEPFLAPWQKEFLRQITEPRRELLHRRVEVKIFDAKGRQMQQGGFDLVAKDVLSLTVAESSIVGSISNIEAR